MNLVIDIGNTLAKAAVFDGGKIVERYRFEQMSRESLSTIFSRNAILNAIISTTRKDDYELCESLNDRCKRFIKLDYRTPVPIVNRYATPQTLGTDRLAAAVGAATLFPKRNVFVVDFGTAITLDLVSEAGEFLGGNISPGVRARFEALNAKTDRLPLGRMEEVDENLGQKTLDAVERGVINGIRYEIDGYMKHLGKTHNGLATIFTGGDAKYFERKFKNTIFAELDLVNIGLDRILEYNETIDKSI